MVCYTLTMQDSWGDGWNGNYWHWVDASGADTTGTLSSGSYATAQLCFTGGSCYTFYVDDSGGWPYQVSWTVTDAAGSTVASVGTTYVQCTSGGTGLFGFAAAALHGHTD